MKGTSASHGSLLVAKNPSIVFSRFSRDERKLIQSTSKALEAIEPNERDTLLKALNID